MLNSLFFVEIHIFVDVHTHIRTQTDATKHTTLVHMHTKGNKNLTLVHGYTSEV